MHLPAYRFGKPYESLERDTLVHFLTGEKIAEVSQVGGAIVGRDGSADWHKPLSKRGVPIALSGQHA